YNASWHSSHAKNGGYALSRIYSKGESIETNFQSSCSEEGGTPGQANCDQAPVLDSAIVLTKYKAIFHFNEGISVNSVTYDGTAASEIRVGINSIEASFSRALVEKDTSIVTINVQDINANVLIQEVKLYYMPFEVISAEMEDATHLSVLFNKATTTLDVDHILLNNESPSALSLDSGVYVATFVNPIENRTTVSLTISNVLDIYGDSLLAYNDNITYFNPELGDLVFNEIMPDPNPVITNLPEAEYIELYNTADFSINLKDWTFVKDNKVYPFPTYQMGAGEYLIVTTTTALDLFPDTIKKLALSSFPSLNNSGMSLQLMSSKGTLIDFIDYETSWHEDAFKGDGGFSLERIDAYSPSQTNNWTSSCSANGGTPGVENCVADDNPDSVDPYVVNAYAMDNSWIMLDLSEPLLKSELLSVDYYSFSGNQTVTSIVPLGDLAVTQQVMLGLSVPMDDETVYVLEVSGIQDLSANVMEESIHNVAICRLPVATEIVINEIMYAPFTGEAEYVELYNNTDIPFDLSQLKITKQEADGTWASGKSLSEAPKLLLPRAYLALSGDAEILSDQYTIDDDAIILVSAMTSLVNESGNIGLLLSNATVIDALNYSNEWHSPLLNDTKGVALERLSATASTNVSTNWFSASSLVNYGTPGAENSQQKNDLSSAEEIKVSPEVFTPNGDGDNDFTTIHIDNKYEGATVRVQVFNHRGVAVKELINNAFITTYSDILWDGTDNNGVRCSMGPYIIWVEMVTPQGEVVTKKMECVVSVRMR
ncbi:MAG: lamin tail domain-containing protein, partial [Bacteroidales bacterium]|nr:lamin tail domain-containing protein [Bacteroidales bacterium]